MTDRVSKGEAKSCTWLRSMIPTHTGHSQHFRCLSRLCALWVIHSCLDVEGPTRQCSTVGRSTTVTNVKSITSVHLPITSVAFEIMSIRCTGCNPYRAIYECLKLVWHTQRRHLLIVYWTDRVSAESYAAISIIWRQMYEFVKNLPVQELCGEQIYLLIHLGSSPEMLWAERPTLANRHFDVL